jgi:hypothetical protein
MHTQTGEMGQIWRQIGRLEASVGAILRKIDRMERDMRDASKAKSGTSFADRISATEKWVVRGIQIMLAGTTAWATGSLTKGLEMLSLLAK